MKINVKGLVFVGFAATVFASSAMAGTEGQVAKNTVTSKYYVEHNFQKINNKVASAPADNSDDWQSTTKYPSMAVLNSVKQKADAINVVEAEGGYVDVSKSGDTYTLNVDAGKIDTTGAAIQASGSTDNGKLVTAGAVKAILDTGITATSDETNATVPTSLAVQTYVDDYAQDKSKMDAATETAGANDTTVYTTTISSSSGNNIYPTSKNVYQYVESRITGVAGDYQPSLTTSQTGLYVGHNTGSATTWQQLEAAQTTGNQASTDYVTIKESGGVYNINLDEAQVASSIAANSGNSTKLATEGAVYNYVGTNFQPIAATDDNIKIGYNGDWQNLGGDGTYVTVSSSGNASSVALTNITAAGTGATSDFTTNNTKLARAGDVYDFVMDQLGGTAIPQAPSVCENAANGVWCALVYGQIGGTSDNPTYGLKWTIMAPDDGVTAENEPFGA